MATIHGRGDPAPDSAGPGDQATAQAAAPSPQQRSQLSQPAADSAPPTGVDDDGRQRSRPFRKKFLTAAILAVVGVALGLIAYAVYPLRTQQPVPTYTTLLLESKIEIDTVTYRVYQISPSTAEIRISVLLPYSTASPPTGPPKASLTVFLPLGTVIHPCPKSFCFDAGGGNTGWYKPLAFRSTIGPGALPNVTTRGRNAFVSFTVKAHSFGVTSDGATASAAVPKLNYLGPGSPSLITQYQIPSANKYDWSTLPPAFVNSKEAQWLEQMNGNSTLPDADAVGTNHATQTRDNDLTFLAGVLLGVGGGALVAAGQEALHARDDNAHTQTDV